MVTGSLHPAVFPAGVAQWQSSSLPSWSCEFDSRHPLHSKTPSQRHIGTSSKQCGDSIREFSSWSCGPMFFPGLDDKRRLSPLGWWGFEGFSMSVTDSDCGDVA